MPWSIALPQAIFASPIISVATPMAGGSLIGYLVNGGGSTKRKYRSLRQPPFYPPVWVFPPVWTFLYATMGYAIHRATVTGTVTSLTDPSATTLQGWASTAQTLFSTQLVFNYLWMPLFFSARKPSYALADLVLLGGNVAALIGTLWNNDRTAALMLVPYALWTGFAAYLNVGVGVLNNWTIEEKKREE
ncbi:TspO/MBR family protein [Aspergillus melleus]|uniref:TspO/MBR family protein n=1 Tax=Aspergillus melleus TaxID=138277 RepID=UPI001E8D7CB1|nr:uncharacterized protein LDX57_007032 [Aspergillus melleus]KAH8429368.1 hypothetical protein LDX57_007032 [Aspergillus melleus]